MIRGAIFDADGTLLDSMWLWRELDFEFLHSVGAEPDEDYADIVNKLTLAEGITLTKQKFHLEMSEEEILERIQTMAKDFYRTRVELKPYVREFLEALQKKGIPMVIATSSQRDFIEPALERNGIQDYFQALFTCAELQINKSQPDIYLAAAKQIGEKPEDLWVFEDAFHAVMTAKNAGFHVVGLHDASNAAFMEQTIPAVDLWMDDFSRIDEFFRIAEG